MNKKVIQEGSNIKLVGNGLTISCTIISETDKNRYLDLKDSGTDGLEDLVNEFLDNAQVTTMGLISDQCLVLVNNSNWNDIENFKDLLRNFPLHSNPLHELISVPDNKFCFMQIEYEQGTWFQLHLDEYFDDSKLVFDCVLYELPNGDEYSLLTAKYDGISLEYSDPVVKSVDHSITNELANTVA